MIAHKIILPLVLIVVSFGASAQDFETMIRQNPARAGGYHHAYEFIESGDTPAPLDYTPFYIAHYSRHGSRYGTSNVYEAGVVEALSKARDAGYLTPLGEDLLHAEQLLIAKEDGLSGQLTARGIKEQAEIGSRMYDRFPEVFTSGDRTQVRSVSTTVPRCMLSLMSFVESLKTKTPGVEYTMMCADTLQPRLGGTPNLSLARSMYKNVQDNITSEASLPLTGFASRIFTDPLKASAVIGCTLDDLSYDAFYSASFFQCADIPELEPSRYFTIDEIITLGKLLNAKIYLSNMNTPLMEGRRIGDAAPFLLDIIEKADQAVNGNDVAADLRFAHDSGLLPLLALSGIEGNTVSCDPSEVHKYWTAGMNICMASNLQFVFYHNSRGEVLVKALQNEQERHIDGLIPISDYYYKWDDLRAYWMSKCVAN